MRNLRTLFSFLLVLALVLSLSTAAFAETSLRVSLGEKAGELDASFDGSFSYRALTVREGDRENVLDPFGVDRFGRSFDVVDSYDEARGLLLVSDYSRLPNALSMVRTDGTVLFEDAAAVNSMSSDLRYAVVSFATDVVENEEDCFLFSYSMEDLSDFRWEPGENDTMYAGYSMLYDTQEERFVGDLRGDKTTLYSFVGENILLVSTDWGTPDRLYRPDGSLVAEMDYADADGRFFRFRVDGDPSKCSVRDENLNELCVLDFDPYGIYGDATLFAKEAEEGGYQLVNAAGEPVNDLIFSYSPSEEGAFLYGYDSDDNCAMVSLTGETVLSFSDQVRYVYDYRFGFFEVSYQDGSYALLYPDGTLVPLQDDVSSDLISINYDTNEVLLLGEGSYRAMDGYASVVGPLLFTVENEDGFYGLYSGVDGQELLGQKYEEIQYANGYVYALNGEVYEIYPVSVTG